MSKRKPRGSIRSKGSTGFVQVRNWRTEDPDLDVYDFRIGCWLMTHEEGYGEDVTRNAIASRLGLSGERVSKSLDTLESLGIIEVEQADGPGTALDITVDKSVWADGDRSSGDHPTGRVATSTGRVATTTRSCGDQLADPLLSIQEEQVEEQENNKPPSVAERFERFYASYPRAGGKPRALRQFKSVLRKYDITVVRAGFVRWRDYWIADETSMELIPEPANWLEKHQFNDAPPPPRQRKSKGEQFTTIAQQALLDAEAREAAEAAEETAP